MKTAQKLAHSLVFFKFEQYADIAWQGIRGLARFVEEFEKDSSCRGGPLGRGKPPGVKVTQMVNAFL